MPGLWFQHTDTADLTMLVSGMGRPCSMHCLVQAACKQNSMLLLLPELLKCNTVDCHAGCAILMTLTTRQFSAPSHAITK